MKEKIIDLSIFHEGEFTEEAIVLYFDQLCKHLPLLQKTQYDDLKHVLRITQGDSLAIIVLAHRYRRNANAHIFTEENSDLQQVTARIRQLIAQHTSDTAAIRAKLYGLMLLRATDDPSKICDALGIGKRNRSSYNKFFHQLYQDYDFVFTDDNKQCLQEDVRDFLRHYLLKLRKEQDVQAVIKRIYKNQERRFQQVEEQRTYQGMYDRLKDERWIEVFLDLIEAQLWIDPINGVCYGIALVVIASLYHSSLIKRIVDIVSFFMSEIALPQLDWWHCVLQGCSMLDPHLQVYKRVAALESMKELIERQKLVLPAPLATYSKHLVAALWWQQGELYRNFSIQDACICYEKALAYLVHEENLPEYTAKLYWRLADARIEPQQQIAFLMKAVELQPDFIVAYYNLGNVYYNLERYHEARTFYQYAIELEPHHVDAWINLGNTHTQLKEYQRALDEFAYAQNLDSENVLLYYNRANVYRAMKLYNEALENFNKAIELDNTNAYAYMNRGNVYAALKMREQASQNYSCAAKLLPRDIHPLWLQEWIQFGKQRVGPETSARLKEIAAYDPDHYLAHVCIGISRGLTEKDLKHALPELERAREQALDQWDAYFWIAMLQAYVGRPQQAVLALHQALELGIPTIFMLPLYWLEKDRPEFFQRYVVPILLNAQL